MNPIQKLEEQLIEAKTIAIIGHENPDADCIASSLVVKQIINSLEDKYGKKEVDIFKHSLQFDNVYLPLVKNENFITEPRCKSYDLVICVDCPSLSRMGKLQYVFKNAKTTACIDHHETFNSFGDNNILYKSSSTCELVYVVLKALNIEVTNYMLRLLYAGIITDTVNLTQGTVKISSYRVIAEIAEKIDNMELLDAIKDHFLKNQSKASSMLLQRALASMRFYLNDRVAIMKITNEDFECANACQSDTLGIVNNAINIKGVYIAFLFIRQEDGSYHASIRGKNGVDVSFVASAFGGGGHETVAAFSYGGKLSDLKDNLLDTCSLILPSGEEDPAQNLFDN